MKREIKFRAWNKNDKWMDGVWSLDFEHGLLCFTNHNEDNIVGYHLMQFTGLKDKNGEEIYEGDILREPGIKEWDKNNYSCFEVFFHDGDANDDYNIGFTMNRMHNHGAVCGGYIPPFKPKQVSKMEVCGNIYENPELLK